MTKILEENNSSSMPASELLNYNNLFQTGHVQANEKRIGSCLGRVPRVKVHAWGCYAWETSKGRTRRRQTADLKWQWPEQGCWPAVFVKTMVCCGHSFLQAQKTWFCSSLFDSSFSRAHQLPRESITRRSYADHEPTVYQIKFLQTHLSLADSISMDLLRHQPASIRLYTLFKNSGQ